MVEHVRLGVAAHPDQLVTPELGDRAKLAVDQAQSRHRPADPQESFQDADLLEDAQDLAVEVHCARQREGMGVAFQDETLHAAAREQQGGREADRPGADDDDLGHQSLTGRSSVFDGGALQAEVECAVVGGDGGGDDV